MATLAAQTAPSNTGSASAVLPQQATVAQPGFTGDAGCRACHQHDKIWNNFYKDPHFKSVASGKEPPARTVPGYISTYISNIHTFSANLRTSLKDRVTLYAGYTITHDTGDGRGAQNLGLTDPAASFWAAASTFPMFYQAPLARISIKLSPRVQWNAGWEFYFYNQMFAYFGYQPYYRAQTGYTSLSVTF